MCMAIWMGTRALLGSPSEGVGQTRTSPWVLSYTADFTKVRLEYAVRLLIQIAVQHGALVLPCCGAAGPAQHLYRF